VAGLAGAVGLGMVAYAVAGLAVDIGGARSWLSAQVRRRQRACVPALDACPAPHRPRRSAAPRPASALGPGGSPSGRTLAVAATIGGRRGSPAHDDLG
jgi:hypothetical protein